MYDAKPASQLRSRYLEDGWERRVKRPGQGADGGRRRMASGWTTGTRQIRSYTAGAAAADVQDIAISMTPALRLLPRVLIGLALEC